MARGRHTKRLNPAFLRDLSIMGLGVVVVALLVFGALWVIASIGDGDEGDDVAATTTSTLASTSTSESRPSTTSESTTTSTSSTTTTTVPTTTTVTVRDPSEVRVLVLNSTDIAGLAAGVTDELIALGYRTVEPDNYEPELDRSRIWYREGFGADSLELGGVIEDALIQFDEDVPSYGDVDIVIVLGSSYEG